MAEFRTRKYKAVWGQKVKKFPKNEIPQNVRLSWVWVFPGGSVVKNLPASAGDVETQAQSLGWEDPLEEEVATHSSILAWKIP